MTSTSVTSSALIAPVPPPPIRWRSWPLLDGAPRSWLALLAPPALAWALQATLGGWRLPLVVTGIFVWSFWRYWLPVEFSANGQGLTQRVLVWRRRRTWSSIRAYEIRGDGVVLLADAQAVPLDALRSDYVPWGPCREEFLAYLHWQLRQNEASQFPESLSAPALPRSQQGSRSSRSMVARKSPSSVSGSLRVFFDFFR